MCHRPQSSSSSRLTASFAGFIGSSADQDISDRSAPSWYVHRASGNRRLAVPSISSGCPCGRIIDEPADAVAALAGALRALNPEHVELALNVTKDEIGSGTP